MPTVLAIHNLVREGQKSDLAIFQVDVKLLSFGAEVLRELLEEQSARRPVIAGSVPIEQGMGDFD